MTNVQSVDPDAAQPDADEADSILIGLVPMPTCSLSALGAFLDAARLMASSHERLSVAVLPLFGPTVSFGSAHLCGRATSARPNNGVFDYVAIVGDTIAPAPALAPAALQFLQANARHAATLIGVGAGTFALAEAGLLTGQLACVPPALAKAFADRFPTVRLAASDRPFVEDARRITCLGEASTTDLVLHLVRQHFGRSAVNALEASLQLAKSAAGSPRSSSSQTRSQRAAQLMENHVADLLSIGAIARRLNISVRQLHREFLREMGTSPADYYRRLRVRRGLWLLQNTNRRVTQISQDTGFADGPHFSRSLLRETGMTPKQVREGRTAILHSPRRVGPREVVRWRAGVPHGTTYTGYHILLELTRRVCARTEGRFIIDVVPFRHMNLHCQDTFAAVESGHFDAVMIVPEYCKDEPLWQAMVPQGLLADPMTNLRLADAQYQVTRKILMRRGFDVAAPTGDIGERELVLLSREPINSLRQLRGKRLRHWSQLGADAFARLGVYADSAPPSQCLASLEQGEVDAMLGLPAFFAARGAQRVARFLSRSIAVTRNYPYVVATQREKLDQLPDHLRTALREVGEQMHRESEYLWQNHSTDERFVADLTSAGMEEIGPFDFEDRASIEAAMTGGWVESCTALGREAVKLRDEVADAF